jgi:hypothetical protein
MRDRKWAAISLFNIAPAGSWTQDLLALIPCRTACSSQCDQKTDLMEETRQYIYTSTSPMGKKHSDPTTANCLHAHTDNLGIYPSTGCLQAKDRRLTHMLHTSLWFHSITKYPLQYVHTCRACQHLHAAFCCCEYIFHAANPSILYLVLSRHK